MVFETVFLNNQMFECLKNPILQLRKWEYKSISYVLEKEEVTKLVILFYRQIISFIVGV